mmetsp:Transcript_34735/g.79269  ORF Transcript_34735/g.79269 Transcript_34735/m.79269 type:complete len:367 (-) Transcript_34735:165-1265(-)
MVDFPSRAAEMAASFIRFSSWAPENPGVRRPMASRSTSGSRGFPRAWTPRMRVRPLKSGRSTVILRSNRPGRRRAWSRMSTRLVAAMVMIPGLPSKPSISTRIWLMVCSRSSLPPANPAPRWRPTASISSMKMMQGAFFLAWENMSRTRLAPTPTNISTNSEPEIEMKGTPASPATALARRVLPVPGGPSRITPLGILQPFLEYTSGCFRKSTTSTSSALAPSHPATSSKLTPVSGIIWISALLFPIPMGLPGPPMPPGMPPPLRRLRKNRPAKSAAGRMRLCARSPRPPAASLLGRTVTSTLCVVSCVRRSGSLGSASSLILVPSVSTPRSWVPSAEKVTFSILSPFTSLRKSEYRTSTGAPPRD